MKAIQTKYLPATNSRGSRVKAYAEGGNSITVSYDHALSRDGAHHAAALALCEKMGWEGDLIEGGSPDGRGNVYVFADSPRIHNPAVFKSLPFLRGISQERGFGPVSESKKGE